MIEKTEKKSVQDELRERAAEDFHWAMEVARASGDGPPTIEAQAMQAELLLEQLTRLRSQVTALAMAQVLERLVAAWEKEK